MSFDQPLYHQNTHENITVLVVDDDLIFLYILANMLTNSSYKDESLGEITVMTANDSSEAVSTLRGQCNNIHVVITDYHLPGLNGVQLKKMIKEEFGNLPVIVISADMNNEIEQETLSSGELCFIKKPIKPNDLNIVWKHALNYKTNGGSEKIQMTNSTSNPYDGDSQPQATKKFKIKWAGSLENQFNKAIQHIGVHKATPKKILEFMDLQFLTSAHVASKLQKYRKLLKKINDKSIEKARRAMNFKFTSAGYINPQHSYNYNTSLRNNNSFNSQPGYGLGQSVPVMNNNAGLHDSFNYMNRRPTTYDLSQTGSNLFPRRGSLGFSNGKLPLKEEWRSISRTAQAPRFGQSGTTSNVLGMNSNLTTGTTNSNYVGFRIDKNGDLVGPGGIRVNGIGNGSLGGIRVHGGNGSIDGIRVHDNGHVSPGGIRIHDNGNGIRVHDTGNGSFGGVRVHSTGNGNNNNSLGGIKVHGTGTDSVGGITVHGTGNANGSLGENLGGMNWTFNNNNMSNHGSSTSTLASALSSFIDINNNDSLGGIRVHGTDNGNGSLSENLGGMNWKFNNNNMSSYGSSTSTFASALSSFIDNKDQSQNNLIAQTVGLVPPLENPRMFNDHHGTNEVICDTINSQFDQNQHQGNVTGVNLEASTAYPLEDICNWSFNDGDNNEEILKSLAANPEMYFPSEDMNITNQEHGFADLTGLPLSSDQDSDDEDFLKYLIDPDMN